MNKTIGWAIVAVVILGLGYWAYSANNTPVTSNGNTKSGNVTVSFTDATADIANVNEISLKVNKVELYSATQGWVTVSSNDEEYKLLALEARGETMIYGSGKVAADNYSKSRVTLGSVKVTTKGNGDVMAALPAKTMTIDSNVKVNADSDTSLKFDVLADHSLHVTSNNQYVFAPVVKVESRSNATVSSTVTGLVTVSGGSTDTNATYGMDIDGNTKAGFELDSSVKLEVGAGGTINVLSGAGGMLRINGSSTTTTSGTVNGVINY